MKRQHNNSSRVGALAVPLSMIDVAWLVLMFALIQAQFLVESVPLPNIVRAEASATPVQGTTGSQIALHISGEVTYQGESVALEEVPARIKSERDQTTPVLLSIEQDEDRRISANLPQLLHDLSQSGVGHRVRVQYAKPKASEP